MLSLLLVMSVLIADGQLTRVKYLSGTDKDNTVEWDFYCSAGMNSGKWARIGVPSNWEFQGFGSYLYGNVNRKVDEKGLYRHEFTVPEDWSAGRVFIVFEGSMTDTEVKINGKPAGLVHQGGFYRFKYDITSLLNFNGANLLEVTVSKESANESINRAERISDYWVFGGIFRPVYLEAVPLQFIDRVAIDARADGSFSMDVFTAGKGKASTVRASVQTSEGQQLGEPLTAKLQEGEKTLISGIFQGAASWDPEHPEMHRVIVELVKGRKVIHRYVQKFGFRTVELREGDGIYVNGVKVIFRGVCRHTFWPSSGRTSSRKLAIADVSLMKDMNMNAVRMSHYPPDQYFLDVCDSMGLFVLDELAGWQKFYDTPTAKRLVRQLVERDVNHPSIVLWDNGNEGGFNKEVREDYALYDPQKRTVIEPWSVINGTNTKHYPGYSYVENALKNGKEIFFPTEFLHGLFDGGHGAGLDDHWKLMMESPLAAGAFLWVFADEGAERRDLNDSIDTDGNRAPDGILGPYHEKEGSFFTVKDIWSPVQFSEPVLKNGFEGVFELENRFLYTNLNTCEFSWELVRFEGSFPAVNVIKTSGKIKSPDLAPGKKGSLEVQLPEDWNSYDVLYLIASDRFGRNINTWSWRITGTEALSQRTVRLTEERPRISDGDSILSLSSGSLLLAFSKNNGSIKEITYDGIRIPVTGGLRFTGGDNELRNLTHNYTAEGYSVVLDYGDSGKMNWTLLNGGWLKLEYSYRPMGELDYAGITLRFPEQEVDGAVLMANGPYRVWKNRLRGPIFGIYEKGKNNTITGESWEYPEFKGYYSGFQGLYLKTRQVPLTIMNGGEELFLHLFTPGRAKFSTSARGVRGEVNPAFPDGDISFLHAISPIGTKFTRAAAEGPQGQKNSFDGTERKGTLYFRFGE